jgi:hypothetical protein
MIDGSTYGYLLEKFRDGTSWMMVSCAAFSWALLPDQDQ